MHTCSLKSFVLVNWADMFMRERFVSKVFSGTSCHIFQWPTGQFSIVPKFVLDSEAVRNKTKEMNYKSLNPNAISFALFLSASEPSMNFANT